MGPGPAGGPADPTEGSRALALSSLVDEAWYSVLLGRPVDRDEAVAHYAARGRRQGLTPHPLLDPETIAVGLGLGEDDGDVDPVALYLERRAFDLPTHPLFDLERYLSVHPEAVDHPDGPVAHHRDVGSATQIADWCPADSGGLLGFLRREAEEWAARKAVVRPTWVQTVPQAGRAGPEPARVPDGVRVSVVLVVEHAEEALVATVSSLLAQPDRDWELLLVSCDTSPDLAEVGRTVPQDDRIVLVDARAGTRAAARNAGAATATGTHVTWVSEGDRWVPGRLRRLAAAGDDPRRWAYDVARDDHADPPLYSSRPLRAASLRAGSLPELSTLLVPRPLLEEVGGFDESLPAGHVLDLVLRLARLSEGVRVPHVGVVVERTASRQRRHFPASARPLVDLEHVGSGTDVALNRELVDWEALASAPADRDVVTVVVPTHHDWEMTQRAVECVCTDPTATEVQVLVVDNGCPVVAAAVLGALSEQHEQVEVVRSPVNRGFALGNNIALPSARGETIVFLNNDTEAQPGWLLPILGTLRRPEVLAAQALLCYPTGSVQSAGAVFPRGGGVPHELLQGYPPEDAEGLRGHELRALTGAALAVRRSDVVALRGFDPIFRNGMEDIDLCLRLRELREGHMEVCPDSVVLHHESKGQGRFLHSLVNRRVLVDRWSGRLPEDDVQAWAACGFEVLGHRPRPGQDNRLGTSDPLLRLLPRAQVVEQVPRLRWALKNPAPAGPEGERWGDTHFARHLAAALRDLGQEVVIDHRPEFNRPSAYHDEVVLLLRGLAGYRPAPDRVNLLWIISHPDMYEPHEHLGWDRVYAASVTYAERLAARGVPAAALLQAADVSLFHPDRAVPDTGHRLLFVGNSRKQARPLPTWAAQEGLPLTVVGQHWEGLIPEEMVEAPYLPNAELGAAYRAAGVVLNDHWADMAAQGFFSNRLFDAVASGARVVSDPVPGLEAVFGDAVRVAHDAAELRELTSAADLDEVFGDDAVRRRRAAAVARDHSFAARARVLLDDAVGLRARRLGL